MTATLTSCTLYNNVDGSVDRYEVGFSSDVIPAGAVIPVVNIRASDVDDISNIDQVKAAALVKIGYMETFAQNSLSQTPQNIPLS